MEYKNVILKSLAVSATLMFSLPSISCATTQAHQHASSQSAQALTKADVVSLENEWGAGIVKIGKVYQQGGDYTKTAKNMIAKMYAYDEGDVLFKPTKAKADQFRENKEQALSYFVKGIVPEDGGFAIQPWSKVRFENHDITIEGNTALAMGNYYFTDVKTNKEVKVEFTFGIKRAADNRPVIFLHHSSLPYQPKK